MTSGVGSLVLSDLVPGSYDVVVKYLGDDLYAAKSNGTSFVVKAKEDSVGLVNVSVDVVENSTNVTVTVELPENATGNVTVIVDGKVYNITNVTKSPVVINITDVVPGNHTVEVIYSGDGNYTGLTNVTNVTVDKLSN